MAWADEKAALLATIRRQEQEAAALSRRFKLLQQTLQEQQKLLDRYQRALADAQAAPKPSTTVTPLVDRTSSIHTETVENKKSTEVCKSSAAKLQTAASTWVKKKTAASSDLDTIAEATDPVAVKTEAQKMQKQEHKKTEVFKPIVKKRSSSGLAATWAEERRRMPKRPKWEQNLQLNTTTSSAAAGPNKENVRAEPVKGQKTGFAYVEVVRNREERRALPGHDCVECKKYYDALGGLGAADAAAQKNKCSRHRARFEPYQTPDDFWRLSFPDSEPEPRSPSVI
ncbi:DNA endonuclease RBBP8-like isoform X1 [Phytophthora cinnamomi]|uniref:DNA endonuclease RBBP8-like isoform X1 n=1 Tax=Phytophthora cinnamomi TaxID=4785 RepID=UPI0035594CBF|nr:DNA endonuclease RBBP8-like isoform X1 [Phytophthora cinnamomi]